jgi:ERCC4-type nuclease
MCIIVDGREANRNGVSRLLRQAQVDVFVFSLAAGHYVVGESTAVLRVSHAELAHSGPTAARLVRVREQVQLLIRSYQRVVVMLMKDAGVSREFALHSSPRATLEKHLAQLACTPRLLLLHVGGEQEAASALHSLVMDCANAPGARRLVIPSVQLREDPQFTKRLAFLLRTPDLALPSALALMSGFNGCLRDIMAASVDDIVRVAGLPVERATHARAFWLSS